LPNRAVAVRIPPTEWPSCNRSVGAIDAHVGACLRRRRRCLGVALQALADRMGVGRWRLAEYEAGRRRMGPAELAAAAALLNVPIPFFYVGFGPPVARAPEASEDMPMLRIPLAAACLAALAGSAAAEVSDIAFARSRGMSYLPLMVMEGEKLVEKHAKAAGLGDVTVSYYAFARGALNSEALLAGRVQFAASGIPPFLLLWDKTRDSGGVRAVAALNEMQSYLVARGERIRSLRDFGPDDRISVVTPKASLESILLEMAAAQTFGPEHYAQLDNLMVGLPAPEAAGALIAGGGITADFTNPPFSYRELDTPGLHPILTSADVLGGPATTSLLYTTAAFAMENPKTMAAVIAAVDEAMELIRKDRNRAAEIYRRVTEERYSDALQRMVDDPAITYGREPRGLMTYATFMHRIGALKTEPPSWRELFVPEAAAALSGN
jgi:NitT/TauT family transport system substrate-binding protein